MNQYQTNENLSKLENNKIKPQNWDKITISLLTLSGLIILFSFCSPYLFTQFSSNIDFNDTGQIGDTLGGIINPFIALSGVILTFLAFYMQIKANQIQITQFNSTIEKEKESRIFNDKYNSYNHISLLITDIEYILDDINKKIEKIEEYIRLESDDDLTTHTLFRTPSIQYSKVLELDRLEIYKGFNFFIGINSRDSLIIYNKLYNILNFLPDFFKSIYDNYENHSRNILEIKNTIRNDLNNLLDEASQIINNSYTDPNSSNYLKKPEVIICNKLIESYYLIINESYDTNLNVAKETDFNKLNKVLETFIYEALKIRREVLNYDRSIEKLMENSSFIRKNIHDAKQQKVSFIISLKNEYDKFTNQQDGTLVSLANVKEKISNSLQKIDLHSDL
ncbi:hypothetical protein JET18_03745 [Chryseobacterium sp. L7]|uniref:Phage abortive infection protein n=1 Tax=Chryseobacterium endalhagicum TaxID=2797638 RepID=A0ABS1QBF1_9FLAO|nr:hypothetical protein [Chryseobacterium endalhagicum]MBL1219935.1 hypothetical protein [Chryseobacterium endalhagicum]